MSDERHILRRLLKRRRANATTPAVVRRGAERRRMHDWEIEREVHRILAPLRCAAAAFPWDHQAEPSSETLAHLAQLIEEVPKEQARQVRKERLLRVLTFGSAGSLAVAAGLFLWFHVDSGTARDTPAAAARLQLVDGQLSQKGTALSAGVDYAIETLGRLSTPVGSGAQLVTDEGVRVAFDANSTADLSFAGHNRRVALNRGKVELSVPKLGVGTSLSVATPDAVVTVHGTRFSVEIDHDRTCVNVSEGVVSVSRGAAVERLVAGQHSGCQQRREGADSAVAAASLASEAAPQADQAETRKHVTAPQLDRGTRASAARGPSGTLTRENRLFEQALAAEQARRWRDAEVLAQRLLARYPASPMGPEARRVLRRVTAQQANAAALGQ